jgi:hypothetical protein
MMAAATETFHLEFNAKVEDKNQIKAGNVASEKLAPITKVIGKAWIKMRGTGLIF